MKKKKRSWNLRISIIMIVLFLGFLIGVMLWEHGSSEGNEATEPSSAPTDTTAESVETTQSQPPETELPEETLPEFEARQINFLLVGRDWHGEGENGRSDTMILCSVDTGAKTVTMISFLRDIYLPIPGYGSNRLNAAYSWGGTELLKETLKENFDVEVDVSLEIDFDGFEALIDYLDGVDIELTDREANYLNNGHGWQLTAGLNHLDGAQALAYSRIRYLDSDFVRTQRQQNVLMSLLQSFRSASVQEMLSATDTFLDLSTSDHTDEELLGYALELYSILSECEVISGRIPADGTYSYDTVNGMSVIKVDFDENKELLQDWLGE